MPTIKALIRARRDSDDRKLHVVGIDLAGSYRRDTGFCVMDGTMKCRTEVLHTDAEIISKTVEARPKVVAIDAPLFLPLGRASLEVKGPPHLRECDRELLRMKIRFFPISLGPMRMLTARGMRLRSVFEKRNLEVIESYPGAIQDILGMPRKQAGVGKLGRALYRYGASWQARSQLTGDELDGITCALVGLMYARNEYSAIGDQREGLMILPPLGPRTSTSLQGSAGAGLPGRPSARRPSGRRSRQSET